MLRILLLFLLMSPAVLLAQDQASGILKGMIKTDSSQPASKATITITPLQKVIVINEDGSYQLALPEGKFSLTCSMIGYIPQETNVQIIKGKTTQQHFVLKRTEHAQLREVEVRGVAAKKAIETSGFAVNVIETKEAALQNMQTIDLLDRSAGVRVRQDGGLGGRVEYNINGLSGNAIKIFIDGVPISNYGRSFSLNSIAPALIERIEVYKGVLPGNLSEDALGGAINVILKKGLKSNLTSSYAYGSFNTHQWNANGSHRFKSGLTVKGSAFYNYSDNNYKVWGEDVMYYEADGSTSSGHTAKRFNDAYKSRGLKLDIGITDKKWADQLFIGTVLSDQMKELQHGVSMKMVYGNRHSRQNSKVVLLNYTKKNLFFDGLSININASYSWLERRNIDTIGDRYDWRGPIIDKNTGNTVQYANGAEQSSIGKTLSINDEKTFVVRSNISYTINDNNILHGNILFNTFERGVDDLRRDELWRNFQNVRDLNKKIFSFTYENIALNNKLRSNIFYKHYFQNVISHEPRRVNSTWTKESVEKDINQSGYGLSMSYRLLKQLYVLTSAERAIRMPSEGEMFGNDVENEVSNYNLRPETSNNLNIGLNFGPFIYKKHSLNINGSFFYRNVKDMIRRAFSADSRDIASFENLESVLARGFDAEIIYKYANKWQVNANLSKFNALFNSKYNAAGARYSYYKQQIRNEPSFKFSTGIAYFLNNLFYKNTRTSFYYNTNYVNRFLRDWAGIGGAGLNWIPAQFVHDIGFTYMLANGKTTLGFDVKNIFNSQVFDNFKIQKPGRGVYGKITYSIF